MTQLPLTNEQKIAACFDSHHLFIEAAPGSGKTTVVAERFGVLRFANASTGAGAITALSFTRSATWELRRRIRSRWGSSALAWPHRVMTIDTLLCEILHHFLRTGLLRWPGDHTSLQVLDTWHGSQGFRRLQVGSFRRVATIEDRVVTSTGVRVDVDGPGIGSANEFRRHLEAGRCTHEEVRQILTAALLVEDLEQALVDFLSVTTAHLIVDEVFDANKLDLQLVALACDSGINVTLVGDPWQALYGFRGARPELVPELVEIRAFAALPLTKSFRFETQLMRDIGASLRSRQPMSLRVTTDYDVVLASRWNDLWSGPENVLPLSFGRTKNKTDAAAILLLDHLVFEAFSQHAIFLEEALVLLDLDLLTYRTRRSGVLGGVVDALSHSGAEVPKLALGRLRRAVKDLGATRKPPSGTADAERRQLNRMAALSLRVRSGDQLVPGMTFHQAKGREWNRVGVRLSLLEIGRLESGLDQSVEQDRGIYVALTRARQHVGLVS